MSTLLVRHIAILVPARNEEQLLPRCLRSVQAACARLPASVTSDVVVVVDSSVDRTREIAGELLAGAGAGVVVSAGVGCVGAARALAAEAALSRFGGESAMCWLANTDADGEVPETWLVQQLALAAAGVDAVAGIVDVDEFGDHDAGVAACFRATYELRADGTHPHVHGANLGVRASAYLGAGGWAPLATAEDHDLWRRLQAAGYVLRSDAVLRVLTSGRRIGRAPVGFAAALAAHNVG